MIIRPPVLLILLCVYSHVCCHLRHLLCAVPGTCSTPCRRVARQSPREMDLAITVITRTDP